MMCICMLVWQYLWFGTQRQCMGQGDMPQTTGLWFWKWSNFLHNSCISGCLSVLSLSQASLSSHSASNCLPSAQSWKESSPGSWGRLPRSSAARPSSLETWCLWWMHCHTQKRKGLRQNQHQVKQHLQTEETMVNIQKGENCSIVLFDWWSMGEIESLWGVWEQTIVLARLWERICAYRQAEAMKDGTDLDESAQNDKSLLLVWYKTLTSISWNHVMFGNLHATLRNCWHNARRQ